MSECQEGGWVYCAKSTWHSEGLGMNYIVLLQLVKIYMKFTLVTTITKNKTYVY